MEAMKLNNIGGDEKKIERIQYIAEAIELTLPMQQDPMMMGQLV